MIRIKPQVKHWENLTSKDVYRDPNTFYDEDKKKQRKAARRKKRQQDKAESFKLLKKQVKTLKDKLFLVDRKNSDLKYTLKCKEEELARVREELELLKAERTKLLEDRI